MKAYETCPVCGGLNCGTACTNVGRWLTPAQRQDVEEASPRRQVADLERERDEAQAEVEELESAHERAIREMDRMWTERDAARAQVAALQDALRELAHHPTGHLLDASVMKDKARLALALVEDT